MKGTTRILSTPGYRSADERGTGEEPTGNRRGPSTPPRRAMRARTPSPRGAAPSSAIDFSTLPGYRCILRCPGALRASPALDSPPPVLPRWNSLLPRYGLTPWRPRGPTFGAEFSDLALRHRGGRLLGRRVADRGPSQFHVEWIEDKYGALLRRSIEQRLGRPLSVSYRSSASHASPAAFALAADGPAYSSPPYRSRIAESKPTVPSDKLNERYTFDRFVVGNNNQLAVAACRAVAEKPAACTTPSSSTEAWGWERPISCTRSATTCNSTPRRRTSHTSRPSNSPTSWSHPSRRAPPPASAALPAYRSPARRRHPLPRGQGTHTGRVFHTFNALYDAQKQIVLTSDRAPSSLSGLEERLVSRFAWGLVADIKPPDYETRIAIVRKKSAADGLFLEDDVIDL